MIVWFLKVHIEQILSPLPKCEAKAKAEAKIHKFKQCIVQIFHEAIFQKKKFCGYQNSYTCIQISPLCSAFPYSSTSMTMQQSADPGDHLYMP